MDKINLAEKLSLFSDHWNPRIIATLNNQEIRVVKFQGEFVWHKHDDADEMFLVIEGQFRMEFRDHSVTLAAGEMIVVPRGIEHRPVADNEVSVMLFEKAGTVNTGDASDARTVLSPAHI